MNDNVKKKILKICTIIYQIGEKIFITIIIISITIILVVHKKLCMYFISDKCIY